MDYAALCRKWLKDQIKARPRGTQAALARALSVRADAISRMMQDKPGKETREINASELLRMADFFKVAPPINPDLIQPPTDLESPVEIPIISWVAASSFADTPDVELNEEAPRLRMYGIKPGRYIALKVCGDSMDRVAPEGSIAIVDLQDRELFPRRCYIFQRETGGATFKRYMISPARLDPSSTNPAHLPIEMGPGIGVIGRVVKVIVDL